MLYEVIVKVSTYLRKVLFNCFSSPELMKHPSINIDTKELGPLLDNNMVDELQGQ